MGLISRVSSRTYRTMGRRRSKRKPPPKKKNLEPLEIAFTCPFCNSEKSCSCVMDYQRKVGSVNCAVCGEQFGTTINYLTEPLDIYSEWIDACELANNAEKVIKERENIARAAYEEASDDDDDD